MLEPIGVALVYCFAVLALAGFVQGVFGMGFAMIATPLLAMVVDYSSAIYLAAVPLWVIASVFLLLERKRAFAEPLCLKLVPGIIAGSVIGVMLQTALPQRLSLALLGFLLIFGALVPTLLQWLKMAPRTMRARSVATFGASAGITEAALNVGAPFMVLFGGLAQLNRFQQIVALNLCFALGKTIQLSLQTITIPAPVSLTVIFGAVVIAGASYTGGIFLGGRYSEAVFRRALIAFQVVMAVLLFVRAGFSF